MLNGVRATLGGLLWVVHLPARALSREQELHADKVAVSIAGSDALIEALARLAQADAAFDAVAGVLEACGVEPAGHLDGTEVFDAFVA